MLTSSQAQSFSAKPCLTVAKTPYSLCQTGHLSSCSSAILTPRSAPTLQTQPAYQPATGTCKIHTSPFKCNIFTHDSLDSTHSRMYANGRVFHVTEDFRRVQDTYGPFPREYGHLERTMTKDGTGERDDPASCEKLQSFLTLSSIPANSMSRPKLQQGQSHAISQAYSALPGPAAAASRAL